MKPIILTVAGVENTDRGLWQMHCYKTYSEAIAAAGGIPLIPGDEASPEEMADLADALFLTGGEDVQASYYEGVEAYCTDTDEWRDAFEMRLIPLFIERKKPIFGICRGMQMINIALGGTLHEDIAIRLGKTHLFAIPHDVVAEKGSVAERLFGRQFIVNSFHHQAVNRMGEGLHVTIRTEDEIPEGIEHESLPVFAVQWHPERMTGNNRYNPEGPDMHPIFQYFVDLAAKKICWKE